MKAISCKITFLLLILSTTISLFSCGNPTGDREYMPDLYIDIPNTQSQLLIKEWTYLLGSGEEVYFVVEKGAEPQYVGNLSGGDDGYCPFYNGKYNVDFADGQVTLSWSNNGKEPYAKRTAFILPK